MMTAEDFCKAHHMYLAKDISGLICLYLKRPILTISGWKSEGEGVFPVTSIYKNKDLCDIVSEMKGTQWDKSLRCPQEAYTPYTQPNLSWIGRLVTEKGVDPDTLTITSIGIDEEGTFVICANNYLEFTLEEGFNRLIWQNGRPFGKLI